MAWRRQAIANTCGVAIYYWQCAYYYMVLEYWLSPGYLYCKTTFELSVAHCHWHCMLVVYATIVGTW
eukprot:6194611-Pleurochrysis_carterae.AAC.3